MGQLNLVVDNCRLTTAEILYHLPDYEHLLQTFLWQEVDRVPDFPRLSRFLEFWQRELDGRLHSVRVAHTGLMQPAHWRYCLDSWALH